MNDWLPCIYAAILIGTSSAIAGVVGFLAGRMREQLHLLETFRPEDSLPAPKWI